MITFKDFLLESSKPIDTFIMNYAFRHNPDLFNQFKISEKEKYDLVSNYLYPYKNCLELFAYTDEGKLTINMIGMKKYPDMHKQLESTRDILTLINSLSKSNINIITKFLHFALMTNHKLRISIVELSKLIKVDTDILQYITSLESLIGMSDIDLQYGPLYFDVYIKEDVHLVLEYIYNTGVGIISMIDSGKLTNIMRSSDELEIIEAFNKELNANNLHKARKFKLKMEDDSYKKSLYLYVKDKLTILKHGAFNGSVNITNEMIDKQFEVYLKINTDEIQLILPFIPISNSIFKQDKYDLYTLVCSNVDSSLKFHRFFVDVYNRYGTKVNNEPVDLLMILCYGEYEIPTLDILERLTHNIEGYFVTINKRLVYNGSREIEKTDDPLFIDHIHVNPNVYMCLEKDAYGNYIVTNRQSHMSRSISLCDTYIANKKDIKPYVFVTI